MPIDLGIPFERYKQCNLDISELDLNLLEIRVQSPEFPDQGRLQVPEQVRVHNQPQDSVLDQEETYEMIPKSQVLGVKLIRRKSQEAGRLVECGQINVNPVTTDMARARADQSLKYGPSNHTIVVVVVAARVKWFNLESLVKDQLGALEVGNGLRALQMRRRGDPQSEEIQKRGQ
jgi:hypothetical protein